MRGWANRAQVIENITRITRQNLMSLHTTKEAHLAPSHSTHLLMPNRYLLRTQHPKASTNSNLSRRITQPADTVYHNRPRWPVTSPKRDTNVITPQPKNLSTTTKFPNNDLIHKTNNPKAPQPEETITITTTLDGQYLAQ